MPFAGQQYAHGTFETFFRFEHHLPAGAARGNRFFQELAAFVAGGYGKCLHSLVGILGVGIEQSGAFRAKPRRISCILLIGSGNDDIVCQPGGRAHREVRIGGITAVSCLPGGIQKLAVGGIQLFVFVYLDGNLYVQVLHRIMVYCN